MLFNEMTHDALRQYASSNGIKLTKEDRATKANLISALRKHAEEERKARVNELKRKALTNPHGIASYLQKQWGCKVEVAAQ
jgi:hypothetical protein